MIVHICDEKASTNSYLKPICGEDVHERSGQFFAYTNNIHLVDCVKCLKRHKGD